MKPLFESVSRACLGPDMAAVEHDLLVILQAVRRHFRMDVGFISEFLDGRRFFRCVDSASNDGPIHVGQSDPLIDSYCQRIVDGRLPELMLDASALPEAASLSVTFPFPVGSHLSVPIRLSDGCVYGTFCCFNYAPDPSLNERDRSLLHVCAQLVAERIAQAISERRQYDHTRSRIESILCGSGLAIVYQPIYHLGERRITGFEALSRFVIEPSRSPDVWFNEAATIGLGAPLELMAIKLALAGLRQLPDNIYISINVSPESILDDGFAHALDQVPLSRVLLEITEHRCIDDYQDIAARLRPLRERGLRVAVDDAGAGYASFRHILHLMPDVIKLDISLTRRINTDGTRKALAAALIRFAEEIKSTIIAEGVETREELEALYALGVMKVQGYHISRPLPLAAAMALDHVIA